jgi:hypothetical protein
VAVPDLAHVPDPHAYTSPVAEMAYEVADPVARLR